MKNKVSGNYQITAKQIESVLHLKQSVAAKELGISVCTLKRYFTKYRDELGRKRWPYTPGRSTNAMNTGNTKRHGRSVNTGNALGKTNATKMHGRTMDHTNTMDTINVHGRSMDTTKSMDTTNSMKSMDAHGKMNTMDAHGKGDKQDEEFFSDVLRNIPLEERLYSGLYDHNFMTKRFTPSSFIGNIHDINGFWNDAEYLKESFHFPMILMDVFYNVIACNSKWTQVFGYSFEELQSGINLYDNQIMNTTGSKEILVRNCYLFLTNPKFQNMVVDDTAKSKNGQVHKCKCEMIKAGNFLFCKYMPITQTTNHEVCVGDFKFSLEPHRSHTDDSHHVAIVEVLNNVLELENPE